MPSSPRKHSCDPDCEVCRGSFTIDDAFLFLDICKHHRDAIERVQSERALRKIIPGDLHDAHPRDLMPMLTQWQAAPGAGLYLFGPVGRGKSHAAAALLKRAYVGALKAGSHPTPVWMNVPDTILDTMSRIGRRQDTAIVWDTAQRASILVMDDIGIEQPKEWVRLRLYTLIEYRLHHRLPTIVTSNMDLGELGDRLDSPQIVSRLSQMTAQVSFENQPDRRLGLAPKLDTE